MTGLVPMATGFLAAAVRVGTPLLLAATGETVAERAGVINLGLEGMMLAGALAATLGASGWGPWTGLLLAVIAGMALAAVFAFIAIASGAKVPSQGIPAINPSKARAPSATATSAAAIAKFRGRRTRRASSAAVAFVSGGIEDGPRGWPGAGPLGRAVRKSAGTR